MKTCASLLTAVVLMTVRPSIAATSPVNLAAELAALKARVQQLEAALAVQSAHRPGLLAPAPALDQKVATIERRLEVQTDVATTNRIKTPVVTLGERGLAVSTPDGAFEMYLRGLVQFDGRIWMADSGDDDTDTLLLRRARVNIEGAIYKHFYYRLLQEFAGPTATLLDGYGEWRQFPFARPGFGKMKTPLGLEFAASAADLGFIERGLPRNLIPNRDYGVTLTGDLFGERVSYTIGAFNGVPDLANTGGADNNDDKDFVGRLFALPFKTHYGPLQGLGVGISGSYGKEEFSLSSNAVTPALGSYVTPGQQRFFRYRSTGTSTNVVAADGKTVTVSLTTALATTTVADGTRYRVMPMAYWYWRQFGLLGEYVESAQEVALNARRDTLANAAWQLQGYWVLSGEDASYRGVKPSRNFDPLSDGWGAWELVARFSDLQIDKDAFRGVSAAGAATAFADPRQSAQRATAWALGVNWYLNRNFKLNLNFENTWFNGGGGGSARAPFDRKSERVLLTRVQIAY